MSGHGIEKVTSQRRQGSLGRRSHELPLPELLEKVDGLHELLTEVSRVPVPDEIFNVKLVLVALTAASAAIIIGYDAGFIGSTVSLQSFKDEFGLHTPKLTSTNSVLANVVSVFQAGAYFGALLFYPIGEYFGRRTGLNLLGFLLTFGAAISLISNKKNGLGAIYAGRVITGIGIGGCSGLAPIYVSEISPAQIRGKLVGCWEVAWQIGGIVGYWINYGVSLHVAPSRKQWLIPFAIQLVPLGIFWGLCFFLPELPRLLLSQGKIEKAQRNLSSLRNLPMDHPYFIQEVNDILQALSRDKEETGQGFFAPIKTLLFSKHLLYRLLLSTSLFMMQNGFGINAITYYSPTIFKSLGVNGNNASLLSTGIFGIIKGVASVLWIFFLVDRVGRRVCLCYIALPCTICMWYLGAFVKLQDPAAKLAAGNTDLTSAGVAAKVMLYIWTFFYGLSWNGTVWVICAEIFPQSVRTAAMAINASSNWFWAFILGHFTGQALEAMGYGLYFLFAGMSLVAPIVVWFVYPETKLVPLEAMDYLFEAPAWRAREVALVKYNAEVRRTDSDTEETDISA